jgi:hypothetical protein
MLVVHDFCLVSEPPPLWDGALRSNRAQHFDEMSVDDLFALLCLDLLYSVILCFFSAHLLQPLLDFLNWGHFLGIHLLCRLFAYVISEQFLKNA